MAGPNVASQFSSDIESFIALETLPLARRQLVAYQFGDALTLPKGRGTSYTATRYNRIPLPFAPLVEGSPPAGETMTLAQVTATAQQWGDRVVLTDVAEITVKHPLFQKACEITALQVSETLERNTFNGLVGGTQINYVGSVGSRFNLLTTSYLTGIEINRASAMLQNLGAPRYMGDEVTNQKMDADGGGERASENPRSMPHYVALIHPFVMGDLYRDTTIVTALSYSDINRLYNYEVGEWRQVRFCQTNMIQSWTGIAAINGTAQAGGGTFAAGNYKVEVTASDTQNQYESQIYQQQAAAVAVALNGSLTVPLPSLPGYTFNVYVTVAGGANVTNLGLCALGPLTGLFQGQATQLPGNQTVTITGVGTAQTPPAAPATGNTVYPTYILGRNAYGQVMLDDVKFSFLKEADKSDPLNQFRVVGWKTFYGMLIENQNFFMRIESASSISATFG
jgi:N4-gp56 family major capsid protein